MKKTASTQNKSGSVRVHGMYGSMHTDIFDGTGLRGMDYSRNVKLNREASGGKKNNGKRASAKAIAAVSPVSIGQLDELDRFGKGLGAGRNKSGKSSAKALNRRGGRKEYGYGTDSAAGRTAARPLGKVFSIRGLLLFLFSAIIVSAAVILMTFNFEKAVVYGNTKYSQKQIESFITRGKLGENTFVMALRYHHRTVKGIPFIDQIDIDIVSPSTVRVNITEKPLDGCVTCDERQVYFSKEGVVQTISSRAVDDATTVNGLVLVNPTTGLPVEAKNRTGLDNTLQLLYAMNRYDIHADQIDIDERDNLTVAFKDVRVKVGKTGYDGKMYKIHQIIQYLDGKSGVISMTGSDYIGEDIVLSPVDKGGAEISGSKNEGSGDAPGGGSGSGEDGAGGGAASEKKEDKVNEKSSETQKEKTEEKSSGKTTQKTTEKSTGKTTDKKSEKTTEKTTQKTTEKAAGKTTGKKSEKTTEKTTQKTTEKSTGKTTKKPAEKAAEKTTAVKKETTEKTTQKTTKEAAAKTAEKATEAEEATQEKSTQEMTQKAAEKTTEARKEAAQKAAEKSTGKAAGKTAEAEKAAAEKTTQKTTQQAAEKTAEAEKEAEDGTETAAEKKTEKVEKTTETTTRKKLLKKTT